MVAVLVMTPEEHALAVRGGIYDPTYRPFPGSRAEREYEELLETETHADDEENRESHSDVVAFASAGRFTRTVAAQYWRPSTNSPTLLFARMNGELYLAALGRVRGGGRNRSGDGVRTVEVNVDFALTSPVSLSELTGGMSSPLAAHLERILDEGSRYLPPATSRAVTEAVQEARPGIDQFLQTLQERINDDARGQARRMRVRDQPVLRQEAASSALRVFAPNWHQARVDPDSSPSPFAEHWADIASDSREDDAITDDASRFPDWERSGTTHNGWWAYLREGRRLLIKNINVSPEEAQTGADLVYVHRHPDAVVLVQYKILTSLANGRRIFRPDGRLDDQVNRMAGFEAMEPGAVDGDALDTYRISTGFSFVKFVEPTAARASRGAGDLHRGYYFPTDLARRMLRAPGIGPQGGAVHYVTEHRSLQSALFEALVRDVWVGSTGDITTRLRSILGLTAVDNSSLVLAFDEPVEPASG